MNRLTRWLVVLGLILGPKWAFAINTEIWQSSHTLTADTTKNLCVNQRGLLHSVCISSATATANSDILIYASSATTANLMANINTVNTGCFTYNVTASTPTGLTYSTVGAGADIQIMFQCY